MAADRIELKVFISNRDSKCDECADDLGRKAWIALAGDRGALCLACADLDHLVFLPAGNAALTRRARAQSRLSALVLRWSRARKRYERQGLLVEEEALGRAEQECLADADARELRQARTALRRAELDQEYVQRFAGHVRRMFPYCPLEREVVIAEHACRKYSGRVGRSAAAKRLDDEAVLLAVVAHVRHVETSYDDLLVRGYGRRAGRQQVHSVVDGIVRRWTEGPWT